MTILFKYRFREMYRFPRSLAMDFFNEFAVVYISDSPEIPTILQVSSLTFMAELQVGGLGCRAGGIVIGNHPKQLLAYLGYNSF